MPRIAIPSLAVLLSMLPAWAQEPAPVTVQLTGRVVTPLGQPIAGAAVAFVPRDAITTAQLLAEPPLRTDAEGRFVIVTTAVSTSDELTMPALQIAAKGMAAIAPPVLWKQRPPTPGQESRLRADTDVGDLVMPEGARLFGRVRDAEGKGIGGVVVTMRDLLDGHRVLVGTASSAHCRAVSNASGIFELPGALGNGVVVEFASPGHLRQVLYGVGAGAPLEVTMAASPGRIAGRIVDRGGAPVAGAIVRAAYERSGNTTRVRAAADGSFDLPIEQPGRFRVSAYRPRATNAPRQNLETAESPVLAAPIANLELTLKVAASQAAAGDGVLRVQAVEAASGKPVTGFRAIAIWQTFALQNAAYLDYLATMWLNGVPPVEGNEATVKGPGENEPRTGAVRVLAKGFAPATERDVEWADAEAERKTIIVKLVPEASLSGRVVDDRTGAPVAGASVWVQRKQDRSMGSFGSGNEVPEDAVTTAADGTFRIGQLGEGDWVVRHRHVDRPAPPVVEVALKAEEQKGDLELKLAAGARVAGRVTGLPIPPGSKVLLTPVATPRPGAMQYYSSSSTTPNDPKVPLASDGSFAFSGIALANFFLVVELPSAPRCGGALYVPLEPLRVRPAGVQRDFDASLDLPSRLRGTVRFPKAVPTGAVVMVVAEQLNEENEQQQIFSSSQQVVGTRAFVQADGTFALPVVSGTHRLRVVDAATGVVLATAPQRLVAPVGGEVATTVDVPLTEFVVQLQPAAAEAGPLLHVDRLEVRHQSSTKDERQVIFAGNEQYDTGAGLPVPAGATTVRLWLPEGKATLLARGSASSIVRTKDRSAAMAPLAKEEVDIPVDEKVQREVVLRVAAAPAVEAEEAKPAAEDAAKKK